MTDSQNTTDVSALLSMTKEQLAQIVASCAFGNGDIYVPTVNQLLENKPLIATFVDGIIHAAEYQRDAGWYVVYDARFAREGAAWWDGEFWLTRPANGVDDFPPRFGDAVTITVNERLVQP